MMTFFKICFYIFLAFCFIIPCYIVIDGFFLESICCKIQNKLLKFFCKLLLFIVLFFSFCYIFDFKINLEFTIGNIIFFELVFIVYGVILIGILDTIISFINNIRTKSKKKNKKS